MTPAVQYLKKHNIEYRLHSYSMENSAGQYGQDVADVLSVSHQQLFKTLMIALNGEPTNLAVCIIPVSKTLNLKLAAKAHGAKKATMADIQTAEKLTGYIVGGICPIGQKRLFSTCIDISIAKLDDVYFSAGKRGLQVQMKAKDLVDVLKAEVIEISNVV